MKLPWFLVIVAVLLWPAWAAAQGCANFSRYCSPTYNKPSYNYGYSYPYYYPTYIQYVPYYSPLYPSYYGSTSSADQATSIATQAAAKIIEDNDRKRIIELLLEIKAKGGNVPADLIPKAPMPKPDIPADPTPKKPTAIRTPVDDKFAAAVNENCLRCHGGPLARTKGGGFDLSDLGSLSYFDRLKIVQETARKTMPKDKPFADDKLGPFVGLASDHAEAAKQYVRKEP